MYISVICVKGNFISWGIPLLRKLLVDISIHFEGLDVVGSPCRLLYTLELPIRHASDAFTATQHHYFALLKIPRKDYDYLLFHAHFVKIAEIKFTKCKFLHKIYLSQKTPMLFFFGQDLSLMHLNTERNIYLSQTRNIYTQSVFC